MITLTTDECKKEFCRIHKTDATFNRITKNFAMRVFLGSYAWNCSRETAAAVMDMRDGVGGAA